MNRRLCARMYESTVQSTEDRKAANNSADFDVAGKTRHVHQNERLHLTPDLHKIVAQRGDITHGCWNRCPELASQYRPS